MFDRKKKLEKLHEKLNNQYIKACNEESPDWELIIKVKNARDKCVNEEMKLEKENEAIRYRAEKIFGGFRNKREGVKNDC